MKGFFHLLLSYKGAERHPFGLFLWGVIYASLSLWVSLWIMPEYASIFMIVFSLISCLYIVQKILIHEELYEKNLFSENKILKKHGKALTCFLALFLGFLFAFSFWAIVLPNDIFSQVFEIQSKTVSGVRSLTGNAVSSSTSLEIIVLNNLKVVLFSLFLALFYGAGAIFVLAWNASVMGFVIGSIIRNTSQFVLLPIAFFKYLLHGLPEMLAYFVAALAGGIIFVTFMKGDFEKEQLKRTAKDVGVLLIISAVLILLAAIIEVYVSSKI